MRYASSIADVPPLASVIVRNIMTQWDSVASKNR
jgi:hypothetical protein